VKIALVGSEISLFQAIVKKTRKKVREVKHKPAGLQHSGLKNTCNSLTKKMFTIDTLKIPQND